MTAELIAFVRENALTAPGQCLTCAVSGGADSMAMLWALYLARETLGIALRCAHYHHGLRESADRDEAFVRAFCAAHGIAFCSERGDAARSRLPGESIELAARRLRYDFLERCAMGGPIATAHTADDNLETILLHLTRGASPRGLGGIPVRQGQRIRPILFATREEILAFLAREGVGFCEDETNASDFCPRNRIRHHVVPLLRAENPAVAALSVPLGQTLRQEDAYLSDRAAEALADAAAGGGWQADALRALPGVLRDRALFAILQRAGVAAPTRRHLALARQLLDSSDPSARITLPGGCVLRREYGRILPGPVPELAIAPTPLAIPGLTSLPGVHIRCTDPRLLDAVPDGPATFCLRCDRLAEGLSVRSRQAGDRLRLPGGSRSLKRLMIDRRIPAALRSRIPVLADGQGVVAVPGIGADPRYLASCGQWAVTIEIEIEAFSHAQ